MNPPKKRLGRGLDGLIQGGLNAGTPATPSNRVQPPAVQIDKLRIETNIPQPAPKATSQKNEALLNDLNSLLKKTQAEAANDAEQASEFSAAENAEQAPEATDEQLAAQASGATKAPQSSNNNDEVDSPQGSFALISLKNVKVSPYQRRKEFNKESIAELANSIRAEGLMQPIVVRPSSGGTYELIAGERRLRACESLGLDRIPARLVSVPNASAAVMGLIENLQRENLNPVEEAKGYGMLLSDFHMTQEQIAERTGKARATVANSLRLLLLEPEVLGYLSKGQITAGHAKVLLGLTDATARTIAARKVVEEGLSVRQTEALLRKAGNLNTLGSRVPTKRLASAEELAVVADLQKRVMARLNAKVAINHGTKGGKMVVYYKSNAELEGILKRIGM